MYCKSCGYRGEETTEKCPECGVKIKSELLLTVSAPRRVRWRVLVGALLVALALFVLVPRFVFRSEFDVVGPTDKLKLLQALGKSEYRRIGQRGFRVDRDDLFVIWDLRWNTLEIEKKRQIVRAVGRAWDVVVGGAARFEIEGLDGVVAEYRGGEIRLDNDPQQPQ